jgi:hypothetical protein
MSGTLSRMDLAEGVEELLQNAAVATGAGTAIQMQGVNFLTVFITGITTATVSFEGTIDGTNWFAVGLKTAADGVAVTSATANGAFKLPADGPILRQFRANITAWTAGTITVRARKARV